MATQAFYAQSKELPNYELLKKQVRSELNGKAGIPDNYSITHLTYQVLPSDFFEKGQKLEDKPKPEKATTKPIDPDPRILVLKAKEM